MKTRYLPWALLAVILVHGASLGLTDDEAYYWILAQRPALGYAFHPPAVAWSIALAQALFGWAFGHACAGLVRLPAAAGIAAVLALALRWLRSAGVHEARLGSAACVLLSFAGLFSLSWMMVPDVPLFVGWMLAFTGLWEISSSEAASDEVTFRLGIGVALAMLSKYSAVLILPSIAWVGLFQAPRLARSRVFFAAGIGAIVSLVPVLLWNSRHEWASILYQIRDRHGESRLSLLRYLRFWGIECAVAGPGAVAAFFGLFRAEWKGKRPLAYCLAWAVPAAAVFCVQPLVSDFKPHWAFVVWWPALLALAWWAGATERPSGIVRGLIRVQVSYGLALGALVLVACHFPILGWVRGQADPRGDVTNDLYGWSQLGPWLRSRLDATDFDKLPLTCTWYQTASQAAFALGAPERANLIPRDLKQADEWPELGLTDSIGPAWPRLLKPVLFFADNRYDAGPDFKGASCRKLGRLTATRWGIEAKWIDAWKCEPDPAPRP